MTSKIIVIKYGGAAQQDPATTVQDIVSLKKSGMHPIIVHGGGPEISRMCQKLGIVPTFVNGLRVTDQETLEVVQMVLAGKINKELVFLLNQQNCPSVGLSGLDGNLLIAKQADALGCVGEVERVNPEILLMLMEAGYIPVIAPVAHGYNLNADCVAAAIAIALKTDHLVFLTDVKGVLKCIDDPSSTMEKIHSSDIETLLQEGTLKGGMIPKIKGALAAVQGGVKEVHILDGRKPHALLHHFLGIQKQGTTIDGN